MFKILLDNIENDRELEIELPIVPRIGDWIELNNEDEFTDGEIFMNVSRVIISPTSDIIKVTVDYND